MPHNIAIFKIRRQFIVCYTLDCKSLVNIFKASVLILKCIEVLMAKNLMRRGINVCCDSRAALAALAKTTSKSSLFRERMQMLGKLSELNKVTLVWIPKYQEADRLAKEVAIEAPLNHFTAVSFNVGKTLIKNHLTEASGGGLPVLAANSRKC
jgi:hypothetical protein